MTDSCVLKAENRQAANLTPEGKKEHLFYGLFAIVYFALGALTVWDLFYDVCNIVGSVVCNTPKQALVHLVRIAPRALTALAVVVLGSAGHVAYRAKTEKGRIGAWRSAGVLSGLFGVAIAGYVAVGLSSGLYEKWIEGFVTILFPFDSFLVGVLLVLQGVGFFLYADKLQKRGTRIPVNADAPCVVFRAFDCIFYTLACCAAQCGLAACLYGPFVMRWTEGGVFFNCMLLLNYFAAFAMAVLYRFVYVETAEQKKKQVQIRLSIAVLLTNAALFVLYFVALSRNLGAPNWNAFAILPIDYTASVHAFAGVYGIVNLLSPLCALVKGLLRKKCTKA